MVFTASNVVNDMKNFLRSHGHEFCDLTLVLKDEKIPAHMAVLAARSKYFEAMFRNFMPSDGCVNVRNGLLPLEYLYYIGYVIVIFQS